MPTYANNEPPEQRGYKNAVYKALRKEFGDVPRKELIRLAFAAGVHKFHPDGIYHYPIDDRYWPAIYRAELRLVKAS